METSCEKIYTLFENSILDWHRQFEGHPQPYDCILAIPESYSGWQELMFQKNQIDCRQWHVEDEIRRDDIKPETVVDLKRKIDELNQKRTDLVEQIEDRLAQTYAGIMPIAGARLNTETGGWAIDRLSILTLKIYHVNEQCERTDITEETKLKHKAKLQVLLEQKSDLIQSLDQLFQEFLSGKCKFKVYRQMKLYNDPTTNPALYKNK